MLRDTFGSLWATLMFSCVLLAPGYICAYGTDLLAFRTRSLCEQLAWSIVLSFGLGTILTVAATWLAGAVGGAVLLLLFIVGAAAIFIQAASRKVPWRRAFPFFALALLICVVVTASLIDVGIHQRLFMSVTAYDNALRTSFVEAVLHTGVPPANPVYWPGHNAPMRYYYFWYADCAAVAKLGHVTARQVLIGSSIWSVFGVAAALGLFFRHFLDWQGEALGRRWWIAVALLSVTGFDGLIALIVYLHSRTVARDIEWWSLDQVTSWADTFLWVPHHAAALVCSVGCLILIWTCMRTPPDRSHQTMAVLAGIFFASAFGLSSYVAVGLVLIMAPLAVRECLTGNVRSSLKACLTAATAAALVLAPYLLQLLAPQPGARQSAGHLFVFGMRELLPPVVLLGVPGLRSIGATHPHLAKEIAAALLLAPSYLLELGFFALALIALHRKREKTDSERALLFLAWTGLIVVSIVRSHAIAMNDYAVRATLLPQFFLLPVGVLALERLRSLPRVFLLAAALIGVAGTVYQILLLRLYLPIHEREGMAAYVNLSHRNYLLRNAYSDMQRQIAPNARVQFNVPNSSYLGFAQLGNVGRQVIVEDAQCNDSFGGEIGPCEKIQSAVAQLFAGASVESAPDASSLCAAIGAQYLVATSWDTVWKQTGNWPWTLPAVVDTPDVRVLDCEKASR